MHTRRRALLTAVIALTTVTAGTALPASGSTRPPRATLTNLAHLDWLGDTVAPPAQAGHTTYRLAQRPEVGVLWTYADRQSDGSYRRVGGGTYDAASDTYGQGAYNADDVSRAAVVYLRHYRQHHDAHSRDRAYDLLRGLTYLQTSSGPDAGNVVLWMQHDGTLTPTADPPEQPAPSDSDASYWLARTVWALGEGYAAFRHADPAFASFLRGRLDLSVRALDREVLDRYGSWDVADGTRVPGWLIAGGADSTAEAVLGLAAFIEADRGRDAVHNRAVRVTREFAEGIAAMRRGTPTTFPYGAILPWTESQSQWHTWGSQQPGALAAASRATGNRRLLAPAVSDTASFTARLLVDDGPDNGWQPTPTDRTQIAYGVDSRLQSLLAVAQATHRRGIADLAAIDAAWYFGANRAGVPMYDRATGVTYDGLSGDGTVNLNSGAESTIHGLLSMLALDAHPRVAAAARRLTSVGERHATELVEAESATLSGGATSAPADPAWNGEALYSGAVVTLPAGASATWTLPAGELRRVEAVLDRNSGAAVDVAWSSGSRPLGRTAAGNVGAQGITGAPGALLPVPVPRVLPAGASALTVRASGTGAPARLDALLVQPLVSRVVLAGRNGGTALLRSTASAVMQARVAVPGSGRATVRSYDAAGRLRAVRHASGATLRVAVLPGGFTVATR